VGAISSMGNCVCGECNKSRNTRLGRMSSYNPQGHKKENELMRMSSCMRICPIMSNRVALLHCASDLGMKLTPSDASIDLGFMACSSGLSIKRDEVESSDR
jgi:hypothetical protein